MEAAALAQEMPLCNFGSVDNYGSIAARALSTRARRCKCRYGLFVWGRLCGVRFWKMWPCFAKGLPAILALLDDFAFELLILGDPPDATCVVFAARNNRIPAIVEGARKDLVGVALGTYVGK